MKKIALAIISLFTAIGVVGIVPAQADVQESIVIIDSNFDTSLVTGDYVEVCVVAVHLCDRNDKPRRAADYRNYNHGTIMADVVRAHNPNANLILIRAANLRTSVVSGVGFKSALDWIEANASEYNITKVSFSYNVGNGARCMPTTPGFNVNVMANAITNSISNLKVNGVTIFAASGNYGAGNSINYPACIPDVVAVGSSLYRGSQAQSDIVHRGLTFTSSTITSNRTSLQDQGDLLLNGRQPLRVGNTTSVATAIVAATN
jgi:hypothetical protein